MPEQLNTQQRQCIYYLSQGMTIAEITEKLSVEKDVILDWLENDLVFQLELEQRKQKSTETAQPYLQGSPNKKKSLKYNDIILEAWQITWRNKYLWVFGFFAALNFSGASSGTNLTQGGAWLFQNIDTILTTRGLFSVLLGGFSIVLWLVGTNARIGIIYEVSAIDGSRKSISNVRKLFLISINFFVRIILMQLLIWLPITLLNIGSSILAAPVVESFNTSFESGQPPNFGSFGFVWLLGCTVSLLIIPLSFVDAFSYRSIVIENLDVKSGIKRALRLIQANISTILILSIVTTILGFIFSLILGISVSPLSFWVLHSMMQLTEQCIPFSGDTRAMMECMNQVNTDPTVIGPFLIVSIVFAALSSIFVVFQSAVFTLAYTRFEGPEIEEVAT